MPVARFLCVKTGRTLSLLPRQLIPYHQYTTDAVVGALLMVYDFQKMGQVGYHGATLKLDPDCWVTPYLVQTWAVLLLSGFLRGHHVLHEEFPLPTFRRVGPKDMITTIFLYLQSGADGDCPTRHSVVPIIRYHFIQTGKWLFGRTSCERMRSP